MINFKELEISGLFGETDVKIPIKDNRIILVGYNGIGKSTILNIFYFFISQQWHKLHELDFHKVSLQLKNKNRKLVVERDHILQYLGNQRRLRKSPRNMNPRRIRMLRDASELLSRRESQRNRLGSEISSSITSDIQYLQDRLHTSAIVARDLVREIHQLTFSEIDTDSKSFKNMSDVDDFLSTHLEGRILYLPTYRRIEKDIKTVFPEFEEELQNRLSRRRHGSFRAENYIELVQFGMEDVKENLAARLERVKAHALSQINSLTTKYLRDVIRDEAKEYDEEATSQISKEALSSVFSKVDSTILSDQDKEKIERVVGKIIDGEELLENEKYVAHYVLYLVEVGNTIAKLEQPIQKFVEICNSYLYGKSFVFDNVSYTVKVTHTSGREVEMEELSSGEKQIVSLFSHLLLDENILNYIVIDEPELSLSVDWQQRFLEDISNLPTCAFIGAVTHSPFIFDNSLDTHTIDLLEYTRSSK